jgi:hypothetical protein
MEPRRQSGDHHLVSSTAGMGLAFRKTEIRLWAPSCYPFRSGIRHLVYLNLVGSILVTRGRLQTGQRESHERPLIGVGLGIPKTDGRERFLLVIFRRLCGSLLFGLAKLVRIYFSRVGARCVVVALAVELASAGQRMTGLEVFGYCAVQRGPLGVARVVELGLGKRWPTRVWMRVRLRGTCGGGHGTVPAWTGCPMILGLYTSYPLSSLNDKMTG